MFEDTSAFSSEIIDQLARDTLPLMYISWDTKGNGLGCSPNAAALFGLETPQDVFDNWDRLSPLIQPNGFMSKVYFAEIMSLADVSGQIVADWQLQTIHGELIPVEMTCVRHNLAGNDCIIVYLRDHRDKKKLHRDNGIANSRFASILRSCPICFATISEDRFSFVTPFMGNFLGVKAGDTFSSLITDPNTAAKFHEDPHERDFVSWIPVTIKPQFGEPKEMLAYSLCIEESGVVERIVWLIDVTQSRKLENELKNAKNTAEAATKAKSEFLANMSHEIRTPMNAIIGLTHLALRTALTEQQTEYIETVQQSAHILLRLINDILDFSKIEAGRMILEYREFSIGSIISEISAVIALPIQKKNLEFQVEVDKKLPLTIMGDSVRLHQVILNLLTNATKFTDKGVIRLNVEVVEEDALSVVARFSITDSGIGMTPIQIKGLFQPFSQASASTTRQFGGTGLGLAISRRIVELMHGEISCQSEMGTGTTFTFTARFGIPLEGEVVTVDDSTEVRTDALLVGGTPSEQETMQHYIELLRSKVYQIEAKESAFQEIIDTGKIRDIDFIIFDFSELQDNFAPLYKMLNEQDLEAMPVCVVTEHPELESVLETLGIKDSVLTLKKPVIASDLFNIAASVTEHKKKWQLTKRASDSQILAHNRQEVHIPKSFRGAKILLAEDNKINQMVATELLKIEGFETTVADNGRIAVELLQEQQFDLVLMDVQMPEMDGFEATKAIRADERFKDLPILAMTANAMSGDRELSLEAGMNDHIAKPIEPQVLYRALVKWIRK